MAEPTQDAAAGYIDAVKWIVGISGALLAGVFLHPEVMKGWSLGGRVYLAVVLFLFAASIFGGIVYLLWINRVRRRKELIAEIENEQSARVVIPDPARVEKLKEDKAKLEQEAERSQKYLNIWYSIFLGMFFLGAALGMVLFCVQIALGKVTADSKKDCTVVCCGAESAKTAPVAPQRFAVVQSAVHRTQHGMQAHTFLLDQQTGELWQMICDQKGDVVAFKRVKREDLSGNLEKIEADKKP